MDLSWTDEQIDLKKAAIAFAQRELNEDVLGRDRREEFPLKSWQKCADFGLQGLPFPQEYGGADALRPYLDALVKELTANDTVEQDPGTGRRGFFSR